MWRSIVIAVAMCGLSVLVDTETFAQDAGGTSSRRVAIDAAFDVTNQYLFRGVRQNSTRVALWPSIDIGVRGYSGDGFLKEIKGGFRFWNSLHTGDTGAAGPTGQIWYETRFNAMADARLGGGVSVGAVFTAYASPNDLFTTVKELAVRLSLDDRRTLGRAAVRPYALVAYELDARPGTGQVDGGLHGGTYLELGVTPGLTATRVRLDVPVKVGLSLSNYYELSGRDNRFGFFSVGGLLTVPIGRFINAGTWNVHGGADLQVFGETPQAFNDDDGHKIVGAVGLGLSF